MVVSVSGRTVARYSTGSRCVHGGAAGAAGARWCVGTAACEGRGRWPQLALLARTVPAIGQGLAKALGGSEQCGGPYCASTQQAPLPSHACAPA